MKKIGLNFLYGLLKEVFLMLKIISVYGGQASSLPPKTEPVAPSIPDKEVMNYFG